MSTTTETADALTDSTPLTREDLLELLEGPLEEASRKCEDGRVRDRKNESVRVRQWKALATLARAYNTVLGDAEDAAAVEDRLAQIETALGLADDPL